MRQVDEVEAAIRERQRFGIGTRRLHVRIALGRGELGSLLQHLRRQIAGDGAGDVGRERGRRVPSAGRDIQRVPGRFRLHQLDEAGKAGALGVTLTDVA